MTKNTDGTELVQKSKQTTCRQAEEIKVTQIEMEEVKLSLLADDMIL